MIVDSSALVAILLREAGYQRLLERVGAASVAGAGAHSLVESAMVLTRYTGRDPRPWISEFLRDSELEVVPLTARHWETAVDAFLLYGKGRHPASLNFGDCLTYAIAKVAGMPLLFTGDDFAKTDIPAA